MGRLFCLVRCGRPGVACKGKEEREGGRRRRRQLRTFLTANEGETPVGFSRIGEGKNAAERRKNPPGKDERARVRGGAKKDFLPLNSFASSPSGVFYLLFPPPSLSRSLLPPFFLLFLPPTWIEEERDRNMRREERGGGEQLDSEKAQKR